MSADKIPAYRRVALAADGGVIQASWPERTFRFLLDDGRTIDVRSPRDDSDLRAAILVHTSAKSIEGCVVLPEQGGLV